MKAAYHERHWTRCEKKEGPPWNPQPRILAVNQNQEHNDNEVGNYSRKPKQERKGKAILLKQGLTIKPANGLQAIRDERRMIKQDAM